MSFEDFASTCTRTFSQTPIRLIRMSSSLTAYVGSIDRPYHHLVILCQPHFTLKTISIAFYLNGTAYFEHLNEEKIRQRFHLLNNSRKTSYDLSSVLIRLKTILSIDNIKQNNNNNNYELHGKLLSSRLLSIEIYQDDFKFKFRCDERSELYEQHYVRQLLIQVKELSQRQTYLCELLEHKDQLPQFNANLFLSTPVTLLDEQEDENEDDEILPSSTTDSLWKSVFARRGGGQFLDVCLLKKAYMKTLEEMSDDEQDTETISSIVNTLVDETALQIDDDIGLAERIKKRSLTTSIVNNLENNTQQMKRLRSNNVST